MLLPCDSKVAGCSLGATRFLPLLDIGKAGSDPSFAWNWMASLAAGFHGQYLPLSHRVSRTCVSNQHASREPQHFNAFLTHSRHFDHWSAPVLTLGRHRLFL